MKKNQTSHKTNRIKTPISQLDGLTVNGIPFLSVRLYANLARRKAEIYKKLVYQEHRTLKHECSLKRQGIALSKLKAGIKKFKKHLDVIDGVMNVQDNAILYWNKKYDSVKMMLQTALVFATIAIFGFALSISYVCHLEQGWSMPLFDRIDKIVFHQPDNPNAYPMYWVTIDKITDSDGLPPEDDFSFNPSESD